MKINPHNDSHRAKWPGKTAALVTVVCGLGVLAVGSRPAASDASPTSEKPGVSAADSVPPSLARQSTENSPASSAERAPTAREPAASRPTAASPPRQAAEGLIRDTMRRLTVGPAFDAKLTQHIWAQGREVVGVGRYEQAGEQTGWFSMEMMIPTANGNCLLQQMSDGRLAWTREQVGERVRLRRVDVGRLDELVPTPRPGELRPALRVGGLVELLQQIRIDYDLRRTAGKVENRPVWVLRGPIRDDVAERIEKAAGEAAWPKLCPREVLVAIAADDGESGFGQGLPVRVEFWSGSPAGSAGASSETPASSRNLISLLKIYDARPINAAPQQHFSFETGESDVQFFNDTERYVEMFGVKLSAKERVMLLR